MQTATGEKSFSIDPAMSAALPLNNRSYLALLVLAPGVNVDPNSLASQLTTGSANTNPPASRIGGGGDGNYMLDGVTTMDPGVNRPASRISSEAISEVKVDTFGYQAEYGRAAGLQINAVTKSGTNQFRGSLYDVERHTSFGYANSKTNILNGDPDAVRGRARPGLVHRRTGRQTGRQQQAVLLLQPGIQPAHGRQQRLPLPRADRARTAGGLLEVHRQPGQPVSVHQESRRQRHVCRGEHGGVFRGRRRRRPDPGVRAVRDRA